MFTKGVTVVLTELRRRFVRLRQGGIVPILTPILIALVLSLLFIHVINGQLRPILETVAASRASNLMTQVISAAVDDCLTANGMSYTDFVTVETDTMGKVTSLTGNTAENSRFKRQVVDAVMERIESLDGAALSVPLGNLTGQLLLSGWGPTVRVEVYSVGDVAADYSNSFTAAGVNQTRHQIDLDITATVYLFLPGEILPVTVSNTICVAETIIVGETPDTYLNLEKGIG